MRTRNTKRWDEVWFRNVKAVTGDPNDRRLKFYGRIVKDPDRLQDQGYDVAYWHNGVWRMSVTKTEIAHSENPKARPNAIEPWEIQW